MTPKTFFLHQINTSIKCRDIGGESISNLQIYQKERKNVTEFNALFIYNLSFNH